MTVIEMESIKNASIDDISIPARAYLNRSSPRHCVTTDPRAYEDPIVLVAFDDVLFFIHKADEEVSLWKRYAQELSNQLKELRRNC